MQNFLNALGQYMDYLDAKHEFLPMFLMLGLAAILFTLIVFFAMVIIKTLGGLGILMAVVSFWFVVNGYHLYKYRKEKRAKN